jgi:hypothetical protein
LRVDVVDASRDARLVFFGPKGMRVTVVETASLPDARALEMKADAERERRRAARAALEEDAEGGGGAESSSNAAPLAAAAAAAGRAASAAMEDEMLRVPSSSVGVVSGDGFEDPEGGDDDAFIQRLVREVSVATEASDEDAGLALRDLSVSGMNGWLRVTRSSRRGACSMRVRVLGPRGLEVFDREPMPVT